MSVFTTQVRYICENACGYKESQGYDKVNEIVTQAAPIVFDFDFPIFDEEYRLPLEVKILRHFYQREIGMETVSLWKFRLANKMNEIMPYYNQLYKSQLIEFNPLLTKNMDRTHKTQYGSQTAGDQRTKNSDEDWNLYSDTPQGGIDGIESGDTLTTARKQTSDRDSRNNYQSLTNSLEDYIENITGYDMKSPSTLIKEFRETFLNIDMMVINELEELFMQVWEGVL